MTTNPIEEAHLLVDQSETARQIEISLLKETVEDMRSAIAGIELWNEMLTDELEIGNRGGGYKIRAWMRDNPKEAAEHRHQGYRLIRAATLLKTLLE